MHNLIAAILPLVKDTTTLSVTFSKDDDSEDYSFVLGLSGTILAPTTEPDEEPEEHWLSDGPDEQAVS